MTALDHLDRELDFILGITDDPPEWWNEDQISQARAVDSEVAPKGPDSKETRGNRLYEGSLQAVRTDAERHGFEGSRV